MKQTVVAAAVVAAAACCLLLTEIVPASIASPQAGVGGAPLSPLAMMQRAPLDLPVEAAPAP